MAGRSAGGASWTHESVPRPDAGPRALVASARRACVRRPRGGAVVDVTRARTSTWLGNLNVSALRAGALEWHEGRCSLKLGTGSQLRKVAVLES
jgi:hypothetical protein